MAPNDQSLALMDELKKFDGGKINYELLLQRMRDRGWFTTNSSVRQIRTAVRNVRQNHSKTFDSDQSRLASRASEAPDLSISTVIRRMPDHHDTKWKK